MGKKINFNPTTQLKYFSEERLSPRNLEEKLKPEQGKYVSPKDEEEYTNIKPEVLYQMKKQKLKKEKELFSREFRKTPLPDLYEKEWIEKHPNRNKFFNLHERGRTYKNYIIWLSNENFLENLKIWEEQIIESSEKINKYWDEYWNKYRDDLNFKEFCNLKSFEKWLFDFKNYRPGIEIKEIEEIIQLYTWWNEFAKKEKPNIGFEKPSIIKNWFVDWVKETKYKSFPEYLKPKLDLLMRM